MSGFTVESIDSDPYPQEQCDIYTATIWTLHLRVMPSQVVITITKLLASGAEALTGEYCGGDSFAEWCEAYDAQPWYAPFLAAVHIYFTAAHPAAARRTGEALAAIVGITSDKHYAITTAGDWAEHL